MKNQTVNLINLYSSIGFSLLSIFFSGLESRAESLSSLKNNSVPNKIKWVSYDKFSKDKTIGTAIEESKEPNVQLITNASSPTPLDIWAPSGPFVKPLVGHQYALGYFYTSDNQMWDFSSELYFKHLDNVVDYVDAADLEFNNHLETEILYGKGRAYGLELMLEKKTGPLTGWLSYTFAKTESLIDGYGSNDPGINNGDWYPNPQDKTHDFSLVAFYKLNQKWSFSSNFVYATGIPTNYPVAKYEYEGIFIPHYSGARNQERLEEYHRLDFAATYRPKGNDLREWVFSIYNIYNRRNASSLYFRESEDNIGQTEAVQLSVFPIIPSVSYNFRF